MGSFLQNSRAYNIKAETELAVILSHFDESYIYNVMDDNLNMLNQKFNSVSMPNITNSFEDNFKAIQLHYPEKRDEVLQTRYDTYYQIIEMLAKRFQFEFRPSDDMDIYTVAYYTYDFFLANYHAYIIKFLTHVIGTQCEVLYNALGMEQFKKNKDISTSANKQLYKNQHLAVLCSNIDMVCTYIKDMDFSMEQILNICYDNNYTTVSIFLQHIFPIYDFYKTYYSTLLYNEALHSDIIACTQWEIQRRYSTIALS